MAKATGGRYECRQVNYRGKHPLDPISDYVMDCVGGSLWWTHCRGAHGRAAYGIWLWHSPDPDPETINPWVMV